MLQARLRLIALVIFVGMAVVVVRLGHMQIVTADYYREEGRRRQIRVSFPEAQRGSILARDGSILAEDRPILSVCVTLRHIDGRSPLPPRNSRRDISVTFQESQVMSESQFEAWSAALAAAVGDTAEGVSAALEEVRDRIEADIDQNSRRILRRAEPADQRAEKQAGREEYILRKRLCSRPQVLYEDVAFETAARVEALSGELPGLAVTESMKRKYPARPGIPRPPAAHIVGSIGDVTEEEYDLYRFDYCGDESKRVFLHDKMGRGGIEEQFNFELRGSRGRREEVINVYGQPQETLAEEFSRRGAAIILTIDPAIQAAAEKALGEVFSGSQCPGAAVCLDAHTGEVLAMASFPAFDPRTLKEDYAQLLDTEGPGKYRPLLNRAVQGLYPLGSVFKIVTTTAALETGAVSLDTTFTCTGVFTLGGVAFHCWAGRAGVPPHGRIDLVEAIKRSCNVYFFNTGRAAGGPALVEWAARYGFGRAVEIDLPSEAAGNLEITRRPGDVVNLSIGQGPLQVTPLQVARMVAAVANGGRLLSPRLRLDGPAGPERLVGFSTRTWRTLREGLYKVVNENGGTGYRTVRSTKLEIAGKTGTAQAPPRGDHAWFAGFAPFDDPQIAFAVVIEHGGHGGAVAGPVAKAIAEAWWRERQPQ